MSRDDTSALRERVQHSLDTFLDGRAPYLATIGDELSPVLASLRSFLEGGKRLRPAFCYWGWRGTGAADADGIVWAATALELLHACALIHDDVIDDSDTRRGQPSVHRQFAEHHRSSGWEGSSQSFGVGAGMLLGDLALAWADEMFLASPLPSEALVRARPVFDLMRTELMAGQYLDLVEQARANGSVELALRVARYKAAKYTIERPLHLGGALAGATDDVIDAYSAYGLPLGEAFQLRDDVLGVFGDPAETGKPAGDDLREGKRTVLIALTFDRATPAQADVLHRHLGDRDLDVDGVSALREVIVDTGAVAQLEDLIESLTAKALNALEPVAEPAGTALRELALAATSRRS